jgi:formylglycine-generating enzyme required for sulfatase activity
LPTEAEWETAGRGGALTAYAFGGDAAHLRHFDWCGETGNGPNHKPQQKRPNLRGLFDMHGNVSEWCHDWFEEKIGVQSFSVEGEPEAGLVRSIRGGTIAFNALNARVGRRSCSEPITRLKTLGFRIAMTIVDNDKEPRTGTGPVEAVPE